MEQSCSQADVLVLGTATWDLLENTLIVEVAT